MGVHVGGLDAIAGDRGGGGCMGAIDRRRGGCTRWHVVPLLGAIAGRRCWAPLLGIEGGVGVQVGGLDVVTFLGAVAGLPLLGAIAVPLPAAIAGDRGGGCTRWRIGRGAVAGCHCWAAIAGWHCRCWLPLLGGMWSLLGAMW